MKCTLYASCSCFRFAPTAFNNLFAELMCFYLSTACTERLAHSPFLMLGVVIPLIYDFFLFLLCFVFTKACASIWRDGKCVRARVYMQGCLGWNEFHRVPHE